MSSMPHRPGETAEAAATLDLAHLRRQTLGDEALEADLLALFSHQARTILAQLAASSPDAARRADLLHLLRGSAGAIGAWDVAGLAQALEGEARSPQGLESASAVPYHSAAGLSALARAVQRACEAIDRREASSLEAASPDAAATRR